MTTWYMIYSNIHPFLHASCEAASLNQGLFCMVLGACGYRVTCRLA